MKNGSLVNILRQLVAYRTVTGEYEQAAECLSYIEQWCSDRGLSTHELVQNNFPSLVAGTNHGKKFDLIFLAHIDVLPGNEAQFSLVEDDGKLYGRGVYDMKFAVACFMLLIDRLQDELKDLNIGFMFTSDEELGGQNGTEYLLTQGFMADVCVVPDGGDNWCIEESAKGAWWVQLMAAGRSAHGSRPWQGDNAAEKLIKALPHFLDLEKQVTEDVTVALTKVEGGEAVNSVPEHAQASLDIRFDTLELYKELYLSVNKLAKKHKVEAKSVTFVDPANHNLASKHHRVFRKNMAEVLDVNPDKINSCKSLGSSDGRFFSKNGADVIVCRPIGGGAHAEDEWIDEKSFHQYYEVLKRFILL